MIQNSYISDKNISKSMTRLNTLSSSKKFRVKSLRLKTQQKIQQTQSPTKKSSHFPSILKQRNLISSYKKLDHLASITSNTNLQSSTILLNNKLRVKSKIIQKDYEQELRIKFGIEKDFLQQIFILKLKSDQIKPTPQKYIHFCKTFYHRLVDKVQLNIEGFNFKNKALERFLNFFIKWEHNRNIISLDLSLCSELTHENKSKDQQEEQLMKNFQHQKSINTTKTNQSILLDQQQPLWPKKNILTRLVLQNQRLTKLVLRNMHINPQQMLDLLTCVLKSKRIYSLDISNKNSQTINRIGTDYYYMEAFFTKNQYIGVMKMDNLSINDDCMQRISIGINKNLGNNPLKILSLSSNLLTQKSLNYIYPIMKSGLTELNLSNNPLGPQFFMQIKNLRANTIKNLDLTQTGMNSQSLIHFLQQLTQNKYLEILKLDSNDFSHHWFNKIKDVFQNGFAVLSLSMTNCGIKNFDTLFEGLTHGKYLRKLNLNYNLIDLQEENIQKIADCLKTNKSLQQVRIRFCGYNEPILIQLIQALKNNKHIQFFDISQNHLSDNGGKTILKILNQNKVLNHIGIQKLQLTVRVSQEIQKSLQHNRQVRQKQQFINLINQNKIYKAKDNFTWKDIQDVQKQVKRLDVIVKQSLIKKQKIESKIEKKKVVVLDLRKELKAEELKRDRQVKRAQQLVNSELKKIYEEIQKYEKLEETAAEALQIEQNLIKALENKIMKQNQKIKKRQNQLQDKLRDQKYLHKKRLSKDKGTSRESIKASNQQIVKQKKQKQPPSKIFDNTKGLITQTKRKSASQKKK